jgi:hypothetical protein
MNDTFETYSNVIICEIIVQGWSQFKIIKDEMYMY